MFDARLVLALGVVLAGGVALGFSGFGAGLIFIALLSLIYSPREAVALLMIMGTFGASMLVPSAARRAVWREAAPMAAAAVLAVPLGSYVLLTMDQHAMRRIIGVAVLVLSVATFRGAAWTGPRGPVADVAAGAVSGAVAGATGLGRVLTALYFLAAPRPPAVQRANIIIVGSSMALFNLIVLASAGVVTVELAIRAAVLFPPFAAAIRLGSRFFEASTAERFRRIVSGLLMAIAALTILA